MGVKVLVVDDEENLVRLVSGYLEREGFEVHGALDGPAALEAARRLDPELIVLDWMLPGLDGMDVLRELRGFSGAYVIVLTARSEALDKIVGLTTGADDYMTKPFSPGELVARARAMLRRPRGAAEPPEEPRLSFDGLTIDPGAREVRVEEGAVNLTAIEFDLLLTLASRPGFVFSRSRLLDRVWGDDYFGGGHVVDVHVANLRKKLGDDPAEPRYVETVRGVGYRFVGG